MYSQPTERRNSSWAACSTPSATTVSPRECAMDTMVCEIEAFCVEASQVLRRYVEERFGVQAPERTSEEFLIEFDRVGVLDAGQRLALREFLGQCDLVKFAAVTRSEAVLAELLGTAEELVQRTATEVGEVEVAP